MATDEDEGDDEDHEGDEDFVFFFSLAKSDLMCTVTDARENMSVVSQ